MVVAVVDVMTKSVDMTHELAAPLMKRVEVEAMRRMMPLQMVVVVRLFHRVMIVMCR
jgi:hypothetical protein